MWLGEVCRDFLDSPYFENPPYLKSTAIAELKEGVARYAVLLKDRVEATTALQAAITLAKAGAGDDLLIRLATAIFHCDFTQTSDHRKADFEQQIDFAIAAVNAVTLARAGTRKGSGPPPNAQADAPSQT